MNIIAQEVTEKSIRTNNTNFTMGPAWTTIWTISWPKALSNEMPAGIILIKGRLIMEFPHANFGLIGDIIFDMGVNIRFYERSVNW